MAEPGGRGRSVVRLPRVEFDLAALALGALSSIAYACYWPVMAWALGVGAEHKVLSGGALADASPGAVLRSAALGEVRRVARFPGVDAVLSLLGDPGRLAKPSAQDPRLAELVRPDLSEWGWRYALTAAGLLLLWSVFGGALARVYALRKARDESIRFDEALGFAFGNVRQFLQAPLFTVAAGALFGGLVVLCGVVSAVPAVGPALQAVAQPAAYLLALVTAVIAIGLVLGLPLMTAAIAVERGGSLDAVSRTFSYVWTRPVSFGISSLVVLAVAGVITAVADFVLLLGRRLFALGASWVDADLPARLDASLGAALSYGLPAVPADATGGQAASVWVGWVVLSAVVLLLRGFVASYLVGGIVDVYFLLREEVDQVDPSEVFVEGAAASLGDPLPGEPASLASPAPSSSAASSSGTAPPDR